MSGAWRTRPPEAFFSSDDSDIDSDTSTSSSSSGEERDPCHPLLLSAYGEFQHYLQTANLLASSAMPLTPPVALQETGLALEVEDIITSAVERSGSAGPEGRSIPAEAAEPVARRIVHTVGLGQRFVELERAKHSDPQTGQVRFGIDGPDFYSTVNLDVEQFEAFYATHVALRQYLHEQMEESSLQKEYAKQLGSLFARVKGLTLPVALAGKPAPLVLGAGSPDLLRYSTELIDAIHGAHSRGTLSPPNWAVSRMVPRTIFSLIKRIDVLYTGLLLE
ncbi:MAG: hypothetical protein ACRYGK_07345, partial [Janthinobacterium lividum]